MVRPSYLRMSVLAGLALSAQSVAQVPPLPGSSFGIVGQVDQNDAISTSKSNGTLLKLEARPVLAVTLTEAIPPATSVLFGNKADVPFDTTRTLYGWPERPGLFCDMLRTRGLGLSTACLRDIDNDGKFNEGRRFDFTSASGDLLGITTSGKIIGVRTTAKPEAVPLPQPVAYRSVQVPPDVAGQLAVHWRRVKIGDALTSQMWIATPDNYTGTEGVSEQIVQFPLTNAPLKVELYGVKVRFLGFDEKGAMRYQVIEVRDGATVPLKFRGYTLQIIFY